ncbi:MAG: GNAT family N-acetyltransferase [Betaproteobacteria bacterium]|nr:MAG: GNAT family N-acetyltransferase [Betaproteobacteria bacterium]
MSLGALTIRRAETIEPWPEITALLHRAYAVHAARGLWFYASCQDADVTRERAGEGECYLALIDGVIVGTIQGRGIGISLMNLAEECARRWGARGIAIDTSGHATDLIALYRRRGYEIIDSIRWPETNYRSVIMAKSLFAP